MADSERLTISIAEFSVVAGCSRNLAFRLARENKLGVPTIFLGSKRMVLSRKLVMDLLNGKNAKDGDAQD